MTSPQTTTTQTENASSTSDRTIAGSIVIPELHGEDTLNSTSYLNWRDSMVDKISNGFLKLLMSDEDNALERWATLNKFLEFGNQDPIEFPEGVKPLHFYVLLNNVHNALRDTVHKHPKADVLLQRISKEHPTQMVGCSFEIKRDQTGSLLSAQLIAFSWLRENRTADWQKSCSGKLTSRTSKRRRAS